MWGFELRGSALQTMGYRAVRTSTQFEMFLLFFFKLSSAVSCCMTTSMYCLGLRVRGNPSLQISCVGFRERAGTAAAHMWRLCCLVLVGTLNC